MDTFALQLYTVRDETAKDFAGTLRQVAARGYKAVEFAGYGGLPAWEMRSLLTETGLHALSSHVALQRLNENLAEELAYAQSIGCPTLIVPWLAPEQRDASLMPAFAETLNRLGHAAQAEGLTLGYHNHDFEFAPLSTTDPTPVLEFLLRETDPAAVVFELDTYWAAFAGHNPSGFLRRFAGRIPLVHLKDMTPQRTFTELGAGTLPLAESVAAAREAGATGFIVENDLPAIPSLESARLSLQYLRTISSTMSK
jgi:sugar phosphate isomerase/epimerase